MKVSTKLSLVAASLAVLASTSAFADNIQHENILAVQRAMNDQGGRTTTVAVYTNGQGVGYADNVGGRTESRFEFRTNAHGESFGAFVPAR